MSGHLWPSQDDTELTTTPELTSVNVLIHLTFYLFSFDSEEQEYM